MAAVVRCRSQQGPRPGTRSLRRAMVLAQECKFNQGLTRHTTTRTTTLTLLDATRREDGRQQQPLPPLCTLARCGFLFAT